MAIDGRGLAALRIRGRLNGSEKEENILESTTYLLSQVEGENS